MAGTLFGLGLSQQFDVNGDPLVGGLLYIYEADTSTPVTAYRNVALTAGQEHPWPIVADSTGRIPAFWLEDGSYRARLTDAGGVPQFDEPNVLALGPSSGGGGGGDTTPPEAIANTGDVCWRPVNTTKTGWVRMNGRTMGSATSGASERANADTQSLYEYIWNNFSNTLCPMADLAARGASAVVDFGANRAITLLDMRGRSPFGVDDMGSSSVGIFTNVTLTGSNTTGGSFGGGSFTQLGIANLPAHDHDVFLNDQQHSHDVKVTWSAGNTTQAGADTQKAQTTGTTTFTSASGNGALATISNIQVRSASGGGGTQNKTAQTGSATFFQTVSPAMLGTWYWRL